MSLTHHSVGELIEFLHHHLSEHIWVCYDHYRPSAYIITDTHTYREREREREREQTNKMKWINNKAPVKFQGTSWRQKNKGQIDKAAHLCLKTRLPFISLTGVQTHIICVSQGQLSKEIWWGCWVAPFCSHTWQLSLLRCGEVVPSNAVKWRIVSAYVCALACASMRRHLPL